MISLLDENFSELNSYIEDQNPSQLLILVDENTHEFCLPILLQNLNTDIPFEIIEIEAGEEMKTIETATQLWDILSEFSVDRKSLMINLGGGVITDLGGFVASTYKRGIKFIHIPTSLLAMCDASIGGKTGIDHNFLKNIIGTFSMPEKIFLFPSFLNTLPYRELRSGFAEMLKHGLIADKNHWDDLISLKELTAASIAPNIERSMEIKQHFVEHDFKEQNIRKNLNFGHTIGHAIESYSLQTGQPIAHGEAVAAGMICETYLAKIENLISEDTSEKIISNIQKFFPKISIADQNIENILQLMTHDKKNSNGQISFSLLNSIGNCHFDYIPAEENIKSALYFYQNLGS